MIKSEVKIVVDVNDIIDAYEKHYGETLDVTDIIPECSEYNMYSRPTADWMKWYADQGYDAEDYMDEIIADKLFKMLDVELQPGLDSILVYVDY